MNNYPLHLLFKIMHYIIKNQDHTENFVCRVVSKKNEKKSLKRSMSHLKRTDNDGANKPVLQYAIVSPFCFQAHSKSLITLCSLLHN